jgi:uridine phosphorylase
MSRAWYLRCGPGDVGDRAVLVGDRGRVALAAQLLDEPVWLNEDRGLTTVTGGYGGRRVTVSAFGMGAPIAAVVLHELAMLGVGSFLRLGTVLALPPARLGDLVLAEGAVRGESTSATYLPAAFPAVPDLALTGAVADRLAAGRRPYVSGIVASYDGFYTQMFAAEECRGPVISSTLDDLNRAGVLAVAMETSAVLVAARALGVRAASLCLASVDGRSHETLPNDERVEAERELLAVGLAALAAAEHRPHTGRDQ